MPSKTPNPKKGGLSLRSQLPLLLSISLGLLYRHVTTGPYHPHTCALFNLNCPEYPISGRVERGFEGVREAFERNFKEGEEVGAGFYAWMDGKPVVELVGGFFDRDYDIKKPYTEDSLNLVFSSSKAVTGIAIAHLISQGHLSYTDRIAKYWPEFAQGNKENVTVADLMGHRAGVSFLDASRAPSPSDILDLDALAEKIASQPHNFGGKPTVGYHATTRGWYINELVRRADPLHRSLGTYIRQELATPLNISYHLGLDPSYDHLVSPLNGLTPFYLLYHILTPKSWQKEPIPELLLQAQLNPSSLQHRALMASGPTFGWWEIWPAGYNKPDIWHGESGSFSGMTNAKGLSRFAAIMANGGVDPLTGTTVISSSTLSKALEPLPLSTDQVLNKTIQFTTGGWGQLDTLIQGQTWTGWAGAGGSMIWWNQKEKLAIGYVMNSVKLQPLGDLRSRRLIKAFMDAVDGVRGTKHTVPEHARKDDPVAV
ncbi:uncharacterized protein SPPG_03546 [Spizellomyces punctatus DAOM BR117]|uniref:Beta-lactamase-related domain-containing protein n=1 Tax=Spizellomyces punctatus (strain DAOM BR117) TaxID=645134 RepID=A0A0L0HL25_SPIPD|nr:uncharacterized protein SPPG_03546 [Spizellomyces punctatus DAOM BR117]KND01753.1 hypothetical protein SPPG_03546 [Spizellomyces punctatus DAOM BR117]|eukprot:XP_016609792.1 hypothetical protein SPPG_03546 [Spizellomyces punctatus DAOM BR117]